MVCHDIHKVPPCMMLEDSCCFLGLCSLILRPLVLTVPIMAVAVVTGEKRDDS